jgi:uncharacterized protein (TIGR00730 family)
MIVAMGMNVCVFCASSDRVADVFFDAAGELGRALAHGGHTLVYGGGDIGLMGCLARANHDAGGKIIGVIPQFMVDKELAYEPADELIITEDMRERKSIMDQRADAFIALPGGFGTLEELIEIVTLRQLRVHDKPIALINTAGFYDSLIAVFEQYITLAFAKERHRSAYHLAADVAAAMKHISHI